MYILHFYIPFLHNSREDNENVITPNNNIAHLLQIDMTSTLYKNNSAYFN